MVKHKNKHNLSFFFFFFNWQKNWNFQLDFFSHGFADETGLLLERKKRRKTNVKSDSTKTLTNLVLPKPLKCWNSYFLLRVNYENVLVHFFKPTSTIKVNIIIWLKMCEINYFSFSVHSSLNLIEFELENCLVSDN